MELLVRILMPATAQRLVLMEAASVERRLIATIVILARMILVIKHQAVSAVITPHPVMTAMPVPRVINAKMGAVHPAQQSIATITMLAPPIPVIPKMVVRIPRDQIVSLVVQTRIAMDSLANVVLGFVSINANPAC
jgi:hypothetical protein